MHFWLSAEYGCGWGYWSSRYPMHTVAYMVLMISAVYGFFDSFALSKGFKEDNLIK
jgi:hypothetical protein